MTVTEKETIHTSHELPPFPCHVTANPGSAMEADSPMILMDLNPSVSHNSNFGRNRARIPREEPISTGDLQPVTNLLVGSTGQPWRDLAWLPTVGTTAYLVNVVSTTLNEFDATSLDERVIHHLQFLYHVTAQDLLDNLCRYRVYPLIVGRIYDISVFASPNGKQAGPQSAANSFRTSTHAACESIT